MSNEIRFNLKMAAFWLAIAVGCIVALAVKG